MGSTFSRRQQKSTIEVLQELDKEIDELETSHADKEFNRRRSIGYLVLTSIIFFITFSAYWYVYLCPDVGLGFRHYLTAVATIFLYPAMVWFLMWTICWWYEQSLVMDERKLARLRRRKREILDGVKDKETYKVAKEILERFDPQVKQERMTKKAREFQDQTPMLRRGSLESNTMIGPSTGQDLRNRRPKARPISQELDRATSNSNISIDRSTPSVHPPPPSPSVLPSVSVIPPTPSGTSTTIPAEPIGQTPIYSTAASTALANTLVTPPRPFMSVTTGTTPAMAPIIPTPIRLPRPVLPRDRSAFDKMVDFLLGEGPSNRYALICQQCHSHNGMALKEEIETISFRCCYCFSFNPSRKLSQPLQPLAISVSTSTNTTDSLDQRPSTTISSEPQVEPDVA